MLRSILPLALALSASVSLAQQTTPDEQTWIAGFMPVYNTAKADFPISLIVVSDPRSGDSPAAAQWDHTAARCLVQLRVRRNRAASSLLLGVSPEAKTAILEAVFAHEIAHCEQGRTGEKLPSDRAYELAADASALVYTAAHNPQFLPEVSAFFARIR